MLSLCMPIQKESSFNQKYELKEERLTLELFLMYSAKDN